MTSINYSLSLHDVLEQWVNLEQKYRVNYYTGEATASGVHTVGSLARRLLFTAPHAVTHMRDGTTKRADRGTGGLAELLAELTGSAAVASCGEIHGDPNWDQLEESPFKQHLARMLKPDFVVIDLHGMRDDYNTDVNLGTGLLPDTRCSELTIRLQHSFEESGFKVTTNYPFDAAKPETITSFAQNLNVVSVQIELAARLRVPRISSADADKLLRCFIDASAWAETNRHKLSLMEEH